MPIDGFMSLSRAASASGAARAQFRAADCPLRRVDHSFEDRSESPGVAIHGPRSTGNALPVNGASGCAGDVEAGRGLWPGRSGAISGARPWPPRKIAMQKESPKGEAARTPVLTVKNVSYYYGSKQALDDVSFDVFPGRVTALLGPNGAGKTTLFSLITRLFDAPTGRIEICGRSAAEWGAKALGPLGVVFQQPTLDLDLTVKQNLRYFAALQGPQAQGRRRADAAGARCARHGRADRASACAR